MLDFDLLRQADAAPRALRRHQRFRSDECAFDKTLKLTKPVVKADVVDHYCVRKNLSRANRNEMLQIAAGTLDQFVAASAVSAIGTAVIVQSVMIAAGATPNVDRRPTK